MFRMVLFQKRRLSFFSYWLIMERSQKWPDLWSRISKIRDIHFIDTGTCMYQMLKVSRWLSIWCRYDEHSNFFWGEVTWRDLTLSDLGLKFSQHMRKRCINRYTKNGGSAPPFLRYLRKTWRGCSNTPSGPTRVRLAQCAWAFESIFFACDTNRLNDHFQRCWGCCYNPLLGFLLQPTLYI